MPPGISPNAVVVPSPHPLSPRDPPSLDVNSPPTSFPANSNSSPPTLSYQGTLSNLPHQPTIGQQTIHTLTAKVLSLTETTIAPYTLSFIRHDVVLENLEDKFYRDNARRFRTILRILFTWFIQTQLVVCTVLDVWTMMEDQDIKAQLGECDCGGAENTTTVDGTTGRRAVSTARLLSISQDDKKFTFSSDPLLCQCGDFGNGLESVLEYSLERKHVYIIITLLLRFFLFQPLVLFGYNFFKNEMYSKNQSLLTGSFVVYGSYLIFFSALWSDTQAYGTHIAFLIVFFYLTPIRTSTVLHVSLVYCALFVGFALFNLVLRPTLFPGHNCRTLDLDNSILGFNCYAIGDPLGKTAIVDAGTGTLGTAVTVLCFATLVGAYISHKHEKILRKNFKTVMTSALQTTIMQYNAQQNQQMLKSMLPESMIEKFKSKDSEVVVDTYAEVSVM